MNVVSALIFVCLFEDWESEDTQLCVDVDNLTASKNAKDAVRPVKLELMVQNYSHHLNSTVV
jgi:hypothetical protein